MGLISQPVYSAREQGYMPTGIHMIACVSQRPVALSVSFFSFKTSNAITAGDP